jgi:hypothetical protein
MRVHASRLGLTAPLAAALLFGALPSAGAGDVAYCVTCKDPDQTYLCRVAGDAVSRNDAAKLYCVVRTAKEGGHASCGARDASAGCNGVEKIYSYDGPTIPDGVAEDPRVKKLMDRVEKEQKAFDREDRKSLVEVTGQAVSASRRGWRNMRASISGRDEPGQSAPATNPPTAGVASQDPLPELPGESTPAIPLSAAEQPSDPSAAMAPAEAAAPPPRKSRVKSIARNTYRCVRSLFRRCREQPDAVQGAN